jgi:hypothetical protein
VKLNIIGLERLALMDAEEFKIGISWLIAGTLKLRGIRKGFGEGRCPLCFRRRILNSAKMLEMKK